MNNIRPLYVYLVGDNIGCASCPDEVPLMSPRNIIHMSKERVAFFLENPCEINRDFPFMVKSLRKKYKEKVFRLVDDQEYNLPDVNGSEGSIDD